MKQPLYPLFFLRAITDMSIPGQMLNVQGILTSKNYADASMIQILTTQSQLQRDAIYLAQNMSKKLKLFSHLLKTESLIYEETQYLQRECFQKETNP